MVVFLQKIVVESAYYSALTTCSRGLKIAVPVTMKWFFPKNCSRIRLLLRPDDLLEGAKDCCASRAALGKGSS